MKKLPGMLPATTSVLSLHLELIGARSPPNYGSGKLPIRGGSTVFVPEEVEGPIDLLARRVDALIVHGWQQRAHNQPAKVSTLFIPDVNLKLRQPGCRAREGQSLWFSEFVT